MDRVALVVSISNGSDLQIAERMRRKLRGSYSEVQIFEVASKPDASTISLASYDGVILGASIANSTIPPVFAKWVAENVVRLNAVPFGFFAISPAGSKDKDGAPLDRMVVWFLESLRLRPQVVAEFEGAEVEKPAKPAGIFQKPKPPAVPKKEAVYDWAAIAQFVDDFEQAAQNSALIQVSLPRESIRPIRPTF